MGLSLLRFIKLRAESCTLCCWLKEGSLGGGRDAANPDKYRGMVLANVLLELHRAGKPHDTVLPERCVEESATKHRGSF